MSVDTDRAYSPTDAVTTVSNVSMNGLEEAESPQSSPLKTPGKQSIAADTSTTPMMNGSAEEPANGHAAISPSKVSVEVEADFSSSEEAIKVKSEAESFYTTEADGAVKLRMEPTGPRSEPAITVHDFFMKAVNELPHHKALSTKVNDEWISWTWKEYYNEVRKTAKSLIQLGLERFHGVGIIGFNSPEWFFADLGAIFAGGFASGIYTTNSPEACQYVAADCKANIIIVENTAQLKKILKVWDQLPHLKAVVQYSGQLEEKRENLYDWSQFIELGSKVPDSVLDERIKSLAPNQCCTLIYTSGTTGNPKGVMLSHDNLVWTAKMAVNAAKLKHGQDCIVSYLPLSHVAAQLFDIYIPMACVGTAFFAKPDALKGSLVNTLKEVRPTAFLGVPRVWEKIFEKLRDLGRNVTGFKKKIATWAKGVGYQGNIRIMNGEPTPWGWTLANYLMFKKVRAGLGLDRAQLCFSGAAPISRETQEYFMSLNIPIYDIYGMSESSGPQTISLPGSFRLTSAGKEFPGAATKLADPDKDGNGEICYAGRHVFMGYLNNEEKTKDAIDEDGWLHSGDIGKKDEKGFLYITGRIKELIITAGGENVPPVLIEDIVKEETKIISNCMLIGDKRKFLSILVTLKCEVHPDTQEPLDKLTSEGLTIVQQLGSNATTVSAAKEDKLVLKNIEEGIERYNKKATSRAQKIQKFKVLGSDFSIPGGELGPTLKLKRHAVLNKYNDLIDSMYED